VNPIKIRERSEPKQFGGNAPLIASRITIPVQIPHPATADKPIPEPRRFPGIKDVLAKSLPRNPGKGPRPGVGFKGLPGRQAAHRARVADVAFKQNEQRIAIIDTPLQA
jgi:hypothetical protein